MASGNGARIVPPAVSMMITQIVVVVAYMDYALRSVAVNHVWWPCSVFV